MALACPFVSSRSSQAAARHQCLYLVQQHSAGFLEAGGEEGWLGGLERAPRKLRSLQTLNKLLAHRPWLITQQHIQVRQPAEAPLAHSSQLRRAPHLAARIPKVSEGGDCGPDPGRTRN